LTSSSTTRTRTGEPSGRVSCCTDSILPGIAVGLL
jgi:hypothetical protein